MPAAQKLEKRAAEDEREVPRFAQNAVKGGSVRTRADKASSSSIALLMTRPS
jgi:hypothetical protein